MVDRQAVIHFTDKRKLPGMGPVSVRTYVICDQSISRGKDN